MATDFTENNTTRRSSTATKTGNPGQEQEQLPCPRCDSINTKFCYYNNYNFSQPRHFCKSCRRYWTQGGTLRDIPVGGGTRKNAKRSRTTSHVNSVSPALSTTSAVTSSVLGGHQVQDFPLQATPVLMPFNGSSSPSPSNGQFCGGGDLKGIGNVGICGNGGFTSLLSTQNPGFFALSGFGLGLGSNFGDVGLSGLGRGVWGFTGLGGDNGNVNVNGNGGSNGGIGSNSINNTWQLETGEANSTGFVNGDCFSWPDLAISTPGNGLK